MADDNQVQVNSTTESTSGGQDNRMLSGSAWMTAGSMISRILGALYIIPWLQLMGGGDVGSAANGLYQMAYTPYAFFIALATAGVPSAISKQVSHYNALGEYEISKSIFKQATRMMIVTGVVSAILLFVLAPALAKSSPSANTNDAIVVMRSLTPALLLIPVLSVTRGLIQGHNRMVEPAISQIVEQIVRIVFVLTSVFFIRQVMDGSVVLAVSFSTFAAFIGAGAAIIYLFYRLSKLNTILTKDPSESANQIKVSTKDLLIEIIRTSIPFIIISTGIIIFQLIDQQTYSPLMEIFSSQSPEEIQLTYGITQANAHKLSTILTSFGTALAIASIPLMSDLMAKGNKKGVSYQFTKGIQLLFFAIFPACIGMAVVAEPLYTVFYYNDRFGIRVTQLYAFVTIVIALYILLGNTMQSTNQKKAAMKALVIGMVAKLILQPFTVGLFGAYGMLWSTLVGMGLTSLLMMREIKKQVDYDLSFVLRRSLLILGNAIVMGILTWLVKLLLGNFLDYSSTIQSFIALLILATFGVLVYGFLSLKTRIADKLLGNKAQSVRNKLKIS